MRRQIFFSILLVFSITVAYGQSASNEIAFTFNDTNYFINNLKIDKKTSIDSIEKQLGKPQRIKKSEKYNIKTKETHYWRYYFFDKLGISVMFHLNDSTIKMISFFYKNIDKRSTKKRFTGHIIINGKEIFQSDSYSILMQKFPEFNVELVLFGSIAGMTISKRAYFVVFFDEGYGISKFEWTF